MVFLQTPCAGMTRIRFEGLRCPALSAPKRSPAVNVCSVVPPSVAPQPPHRPTPLSPGQAGTFCTGSPATPRDFLYRKSLAEEAEEEVGVQADDQGGDDGADDGR